MTAEETKAPSPDSSGSHAAQAPRDGSFGAVVVLLSAVFVVILNETLMNVALPHLMESFHIAEFSTIQWVSTVFMLTMAVVIPMTGFLLARLTTRQAFLTAMALFVAGTAICAVAPWFWALILGRAVQAAGTAVMMPLLMTTILQTTPLERRGVVMGNVSIAISVAPATGPAISGLILRYFSWHWLFIFMLPIAAVVIAAGLAKLKNITDPSRQHLDAFSVLLTVIGFGGFVYGLNKAAVEASPLNIGILLVGLAALVWFVRRQRALAPQEKALLDLSTFRVPEFARGLGIMAASMMPMFGIFILFPLYLQQVKGVDSLTTGLMVLPGGLAMGLVAPGVGRLFDRIGGRPLILTGTFVVTATAVTMGFFTASTPLWLATVVYTLFPLGLSLIMTPGFTYALNPLPPHLYSHGSAALSTVQQLFAGLGVTVLTGIMQVVIILTAHDAAAPAVPDVQRGLLVAYLVAAAFGALAFALALGIAPKKREEGGAAEATGSTDGVSAH